MRALRRRSRIALYTSLVLTAGLTSLAVHLIDDASAPQDPNYLWAQRDLGLEPHVQLLQRYLQVDTSQPDADELAGAEFLAAELRRAGIEPVVEDLGNRKANLWAILEGESREAIVLHNHIDTDPLGNAAEWAHAPLSGHVEGPYIWGRGSFDMKSVTIAQLDAFLALARSGVRPRRSVVFLATGSEEIGSEHGMRRILDLHPELSERFWVVLTEGGVVEAVDVHTVKYWGTEIAQRRVVSVRYDGPRAAIEELRRKLVDPWPSVGPVVVPAVREFLEVYAPTRDTEELRALLGNPDQLVEDSQSLDRLPFLLRGLFFHEAFPDPLPEPSGAGSHLGVRVLLLPGVETFPVLDELIPPEFTHGLRRTVVEEVPVRGSASSLAHPAYRSIHRVLSRRHPEVVVGPFVVTRSLSDARFARAHGIPAFGFSPFHVVTSETLHVGAANEHIGIEAFLEGVEIYREVLEDLAMDTTRPPN